MEIVTIRFEDIPPMGIEFVKPFAEELARKIGWNYELESSGNSAYVKNPKSNIISFEFTYGETVCLYNGITRIGGNVGESIAIPRSSDEKIYKMFILHSGEGTVSLGFGVSTTVDPIFRLIIAPNMDGEYVGLLPRGNAESSGYTNSEWLCLREMESTPRRIRPSYPTSDAIASGNTAIFKMPDIFGGCMFRDIYGIWSCPRNGKNRKLYINGVIYRVLSSDADYGGIAIPDINN